MCSYRLVRTSDTASSQQSEALKRFPNRALAAVQFLCAPSAGRLAHEVARRMDPRFIVFVAPLVSVADEATLSGYIQVWLNHGPLCSDQQSCSTGLYYGHGSRVHLAAFRFCVFLPEFRSLLRVHGGYSWICDLLQIIPLRLFYSLPDAGTVRDRHQTLDAIRRSAPHISERSEPILSCCMSDGV